MYSFIYSLYFISLFILLSPPNEVSEGTMKRAPYVCVCASVRQRKMLLLLYFLADFNSVCFLKGLGGGFKTSTQNFEIN